MVNWNNESQISFPILVMEQIRIIQKIASKELRDSTRILKTPIGEQILESEDTRYSFIQSVEILGSMLHPYLQGNPQTTFNNFIAFASKELVEAWEDEIKFQEKMKKVLGFKGTKIEELSNAEQRQLLTLFLNEKCRLAFTTFRDLIQAFKNNDFLKSQSYSEESDEGTNAYDEDEGEEEEN